ncbi:hypothetical protein A2U01_0057946, partial [Trifolium medium]|nr:hypothetical protein [Trifolium medium]
SKAKQVAYCELCNGDYPTGHCPPTNEEVNFMGNQPRQGQYQTNIGYQRGEPTNATVPTTAATIPARNPGLPERQ